ncbi:MAG: mitochondrial fission ELM1 family protein [Candidatus Omnitrophica bacterium]|nr:mitochondrial fission ELM1 family protein [Candidatus Omnitrophota bacterium]
MKKYSMKEYLLYTTLKFLSQIVIFLPSRLLVFQGKILGLLLYYLDRRHRLVAYKNLRICLASHRNLKELKRILRKNFENFGMNITETLIIPKLNQKYIQRNIQIEGLSYIKEALSHKKSIILLGIHMGNWELCFAVAGILGLPFYVLAEKQSKYPLLDRFLNRLREIKGTQVIYVGKQIREAIRILKEGKVLGLVADHGIKEGIVLDFFGHKTRVPTLAVRLALSLGVIVIPGYIVRQSLLKHKIVILPPLDIRRTLDYKEDLIFNLNKINKIFEECIKKNPQDYLWFYQRFKYNQDRTILVLEDGKVGHMKQSSYLLEIIKEVGEKKGFLIKTEKIKIEFKDSIFKNLQIISTSLASRSQCMMCLWCLKHFLKPDNFSNINSTYADIVVSCGSSLAGVNFVVSSLNQAKSIIIMRPSILSTKRFDLVITPFHDRLPQRRNILILEGALSYIEDKLLNESKEKIRGLIKETFKPFFYIGLLIGGDTKRFQLKEDVIFEVLKQIKELAQEYKASILLTTSRRTPKRIEDLIKKELKDFLYCGLLIIANEKNYSFVIEGILSLSKFVIVSPESISMISEAVSAKRYVLVFKQKIFRRRHQLFLEHFSQKRYIYFIDPKKINQTIKELLLENPPLPPLRDKERITEAIERFL